MKSADSGYYFLIIENPEDTIIRIGRREPELFPAGWYVYSGSAKHGLNKRTARHCSKSKKLHWNIDYLLQHRDVKEVVTVQDGDGALRRRYDESGMPFECSAVEYLIGPRRGKLLHENFGSGDCRCQGHLVHFSNNPYRIVENCVKSITR